MTSIFQFFNYLYTQNAREKIIEDFKYNQNVSDKNMNPFKQEYEKVKIPSIQTFITNTVS